MASNTMQTMALPIASRSHHSRIARPFGCGLLLAACLASGSVLAASGPGGFLGTLDATMPSVSLGDTVTGAFNDVWTFDVAQGTEVVASLTNASILQNGVALGDITGFAATLNGVPLTLSQVDESGGAFTYQVQRLIGGLTLPVGVYTLDVSGTAIGGASSASYSGNLFANLAPVPEPGTWALLFSGLAIMGSVVLRRRSLGD